jgi:hypothetical protein
MGFKIYEEYSTIYGDQGKSFFSRLKALTATINPPSGGNCSMDVDSWGSKLWWRYGKCAGLAYSVALPTAEALDPYTGQVYDAVYALAYALDYLIYTQKVDMSSSAFKTNEAQIIRDAAIDVVNFTGVTDIVSFNEGVKIKGR